MGNYSTQASSALKALNFDKFNDIETASVPRSQTTYTELPEQPPTNAWTRALIIVSTATTSL